MVALLDHVQRRRLQLAHRLRPEVRTGEEETCRALPYLLGHGTVARLETGLTIRDFAPGFGVEEVEAHSAQAGLRERFGKVHERRRAQVAAGAVGEYQVGRAPRGMVPESGDRAAVPDK